jgi:hypothetical protein
MPKQFKNFRKNIGSIFKFLTNQNNRNQIHDFADITTIPEIGNRTTPTEPQRIPRTSTSTSTSTGTPRASRTPLGIQRTPLGIQRTPTRTPTGTPRALTRKSRSPVLSRQRIFANKEKEKKLLRNAEPEYLTEMHHDTFGIVLEQMFGKLSPIVFNKEFVEQLESKEVALLKPLIKKIKKEILPRIETYLLPKIKVIDLADITLNKYIIEVLDMTVTHSKVSTIILRNITFENIDDIDNFLVYLEKNIQIDTLILRNIELIKVSARIGEKKYLNNFLYIIGKLNNIKYLEFSNFDIQNVFEVVDNQNPDHLFAGHFVRLLIKLEKLEYLIFNNNNIYFDDYYDIFRDSYIIDEYMTPPENAIKKYNKMLYAVKKYFTPEGRKRLHIVSVKNNNPIEQNDKKPVINCIQRRGNDFYTIGNKDPLEVDDDVVNIAEYKNIFVMNQMKTKKKELFEKYNIRLTLTNSGRGSGSRSSS